MKVLFVHQNFPAQFGRLAVWLASQGHQVVFLTEKDVVSLTGVHKVLFKETREPGEHTHAYVRPIEKAVLQGQAAFRSAMQLKQSGFVPDIIYGHSGFGATLYIKEVYPKVPLVGYFEWYYQSHGSDSDFGSGGKISFDAACRVRTRNLTVIPDLIGCTAGVSPTYWQHRQFPVDFSAKIHVLHDGVDTAYFQPLAEADLQKGLRLDSCGLFLPYGTEIITYVGRGMEPYRGFPQFMEAASLLQKKRPHCHIVVVGTDRVAYGVPHPSGKTYKTLMLEQHDYDVERIHFTGALSYEEYRKVLQHSGVHVYLTYPFVLSWSLLESMACGCAIVASQTAPVEEVIQNDREGLLASFFNVQEIAEKIEYLLDDKSKNAQLRAQARQLIVDRYAAERIIPLQGKLLSDICQYS